MKIRKKTFYLYFYVNILFFDDLIFSFTEFYQGLNFQF